MVEIRKSLEDEKYIIEVIGEVDASSSIHLDTAIEEAFSEGREKIMVDLTRLTYISSAGLGVFMSYLQEIKTKNIGFVLFGPDPKVKGTFSILGLDQLVTIVDNQDQAKAFLDGISA
ncbi:STAS domain-containing protein [Persicobacter sp. CCB-QB2]|uniref:STAS domain-containing protein n=1 Tax=Persicobacter sp. CCB-QB2 TaxID=1561025 RepID=UPI0006A9C04D|nr:STAS domain-containing protein [Persicobacter sp. CCB-QB2]